jgi:hypothetical protein
MNARYSRTAIIPLLAFIGLLHNHGRVGFKQQHIALLINAEVHARVVQTESLLQMLQRGHCLHAKNTTHII